MSHEPPLHIAYFVQDFPPEVGAGPARVTEMALRWQEAGARVTVVTGMPNRRLPDRPDGVVHPDYRGRLFMEEDWQGLRVLRSWLFATPRRGFAWTLLNNLSFLATGTLHSLLRLRGVDVLIASSPPFFAHLAGDVYRRVARVPMVLEIRDLWPDYLVEMGALRNRRAQRALFALERSLLSHARHAVVVTESFRQRVIGKGMAPDEVTVVPNGVDVEQYHASREEPPVEALRRRGEEFVVGYLGTFGAGQGLRTLVEAQARLEARGAPVRMVLVGDGPDRAAVTRHAEELGVRGVSFGPPIPRDRTRAFYNACDLCLVPLAPLPIFQETIPSKIFEVMACERPVLACVAGEGARIVGESGGGWVCAPGDAEEIAASIVRAMESTPAERAAMGRAGREYVMRNYDRRAHADRYLALLQSLAPADRRVASRSAADVRA